MPELSKCRIGPSTPLRKVLRGWRLRSFWYRTGWISGVNVSPLLESPWWPIHSWKNLISALTLLSVIVATVVTGYLTSNVAMWMAAICAGMVLIGGLVLRAELLNLLFNPLPEGIKTFRDLAQRIATNT